MEFIFVLNLLLHFQQRIPLYPLLLQHLLAILPVHELLLLLLLLRRDPPIRYLKVHISRQRSSMFRQQLILREELQQILILADELHLILGFLGQEHRNDREYES